MLLKRQQPKQYGTKRFFEGHYTKQQKVLIIDDVLMTGGTLVDDIPVSTEPYKLCCVTNHNFLILMCELNFKLKWWFHFEDYP